MSVRDLNKPALDPAAVAVAKGTNYPAPHDAIVGEREKQALGNALGLNQFGVNLVRLPPGAASAQRHWHTDEDEFIYILDGMATLVTEGGKQTLTAGMAAGFPAGVEDGHHLLNESDADVRYLEVGTRAPKDFCKYPDVDLLGKRAAGQRTEFTRRDGAPFDEVSE